jgi:hypothetical protein
VLIWVDHMGFLGNHWAPSEWAIGTQTTATVSRSRPPQGSPVWRRGRSGLAACGASTQTAPPTGPAAAHRGPRRIIHEQHRQQYTGGDAEAGQRKADEEPEHHEQHGERRREAHQAAVVEDDRPRKLVHGHELHRRPRDDVGLLCIVAFATLNPWV